MSMKLDFDDLPYNLFELLEISEDSTIKDIKKAYKKAILKYHPDKNTNSNEEYFSWITLAHKILCNPEHKELYIEWLNWKDDHLRLRNKQKNKIKIDTTKSYKELEQELNKKHGYNSVEEQPLNSIDLNNKINELNNIRNTLSIPKKRITNMEEYINNIKKDKYQNKDQNIIKYSGEITTLPSSSAYGSLDNYGKLYSENDKIITNNITSFNEAFKLSHYQEYTSDKLSLEEKIKQYKNETKNLKKLSKKSKNIKFFK